MSSLYLIYKEIYIAKVIEKLKGDETKDKNCFFCLFGSIFGPILNKPRGFLFVCIVHPFLKKNVWTGLGNCNF